MGKLARYITEDGSAVACVIDSTDIAAELEKIHRSTPVMTAALGRFTTAAAMMGYMLKGEDESVTLRINGGGPAGTLTAVADTRKTVKAYAENPCVELPLNPEGKLDVRGAVGFDGFLSVSKDLGMKEPYIGQVPIVSGEIAEDITSYYAVSEQTPTVCGLGVLVDTDWSVSAAGGFLVQLLPFADEGCIDVIEQNVKSLPPISSLISNGTDPEEICRMLLNELNPNLLETSTVGYQCDCSRERVYRMISSLGKDDLQEMHDEDAGCEVNCHFCGHQYRFSAEELQTIIERKK